MGVWIETWTDKTKHQKKSSHPAWVCGLKLPICLRLLTIVRSHPAWVCGLKHGPIRPSTRRSQVTPCVGVWIETWLRRIWVISHWSHPAWVCGLKLSNIGNRSKCRGSHPAWVCGLKLRRRTNSITSERVTPCVGVWIETISTSLELLQNLVSHPAWVCGLKLSEDKENRFTCGSHPAWVCGLKQQKS